MESQIKIIGTALFGQSWMAQIADNLVNDKGKPVSRQTVQNWDRSDRTGSIPTWAKKQLANLAIVRKREVNNVYDVLNAEYSDTAHLKAIEFFLSANAEKLTSNTTIYAQLRFGRDKWGNSRYEAIYTLTQHAGEHWHTVTMSPNLQRYQLQLINIRSILIDLLHPSKAIHDRMLDEIYNEVKS